MPFYFLSYMVLGWACSFFSILKVSLPSSYWASLSPRNVVPLIVMLNEIVFFFFENYVE